MPWRYSCTIPSCVQLLLIRTDRIIHSAVRTPDRKCLAHRARYESLNAHYVGTGIFFPGGRLSVIRDTSTLDLVAKQVLSKRNVEGVVIAAPKDSDSGSLSKSLKLFDVYAVATGAMFSSGLFLLPGIAAAQTGSSVYLAYMVAGILILPAMFCMAELSTAMPRSGGAYFFLDRSMGPLMGTVGGVGSWVATVFKSAFALVGWGPILQSISICRSRLRPSC